MSALHLLVCRQKCLVRQVPELNGHGIKQTAEDLHTCTVRLSALSRDAIAVAGD